MRSSTVFILDFFTPELLNPLNFVKTHTFSMSLFRCNSNGSEESAITYSCETKGTVQGIGLRGEEAVSFLEKKRFRPVFKGKNIFFKFFLFM